MLHIFFCFSKSRSNNFKVVEKAMFLAEPWDSGHPLTLMACAGPLQSAPFSRAAVSEMRDEMSSEKKKHDWQVVDLH